MMTMATDRYSVGELRFLLRFYHTLGQSKPPADPELKTGGKRLYGAAWWEQAALKRADLDLALCWLHERDWKANYAIRASLIVGLPQRHIATYLDVTQQTVSRYIADGLLLMVAFLNGELARHA